MKRCKIDVARTRERIKTLASSHPAICAKCKLPFEEIDNLTEGKILRLALSISKAAKLQFEAFIILEADF